MPSNTSSSTTASKAASCSAPESSSASTFSSSTTSTLSAIKAAFRPSNKKSTLSVSPWTGSSNPDKAVLMEARAAYFATR
ncbi:hypothetical protein FQN52_004302 [Onygenales sp. PD_12]|nr:hypothetical protein FQN52_004302 [Onygenales sp. PD_12]KAK2806658.1 hypothetical protein FQN51_006626 [Onygenales sp. PD_10]